MPYCAGYANRRRHNPLKVLPCQGGQGNAGRECCPAEPLRNIAINYSLYQNVLAPDEYEYIWRYLLLTPFTPIIGANMRCGKAFQGNNTGNTEAQQVIAFLQSTVIRRHLSFDDFVAIRYESGMDYVGWHTDGGYFMEPGCEIGSLSLGATRTIQFRPIGQDRPIWTEYLSANSLTVMPSGFQESNEHQVRVCDVSDLRFGLVLFTHRM